MCFSLQVQHVECKGHSLLFNSYSALGSFQTLLFFRESNKYVRLQSWDPKTERTRQDISLRGWGGNLHNSMKKLVPRSNERTYPSKDSRESVGDRSYDCYQWFESLEERASLFWKVRAYFFKKKNLESLTVGKRLSSNLRLSQKASCVFMRETPSGS